MFAKLRACKGMKKDGNKEVEDDYDQESISVHDEYHRALRTKSYADFFAKAQLLANQPSIYSNRDKFSEVLLEPSQETITSILDDSPILSQNLELKHLMLTYFHISAYASHICSHLLKSINQVHSNHHFVQTSLDIIMKNSNNENQEEPCPSSRTLEEFVVFELESFIRAKNPLSNPHNHDFKIINNENSSVLHHLKAMRKKVARKIKFIKYMKKACGVCMTLACGVVAIVATIIATHTLTAIIMGPAILSLPLKSLKRKIQRFMISKNTRFLGEVWDQLDVAAKGSYILNRDFDTMSRVVSRLHDEIEHNKEMIRLWLSYRKEKMCLEIVKELRKSEVGFMKQLEELEENVYLCLVTINRARALVVNKMTSSCIEH